MKTKSSFDISDFSKKLETAAAGAKKHMEADKMNWRNYFLLKEFSRPEDLFNEVKLAFLNMAVKTNIRLYTSVVYKTLASTLDWDNNDTVKNLTTYMSSSKCIFAGNNDSAVVGIIDSYNQANYTIWSLDKELSEKLCKELEK